MPVKVNYLAVCVLGDDKAGLMENITRPIFEQGCSITESRMTAMGTGFGLMLMIEGQWNKLAKLEDQLPELTQRLGLQMVLTRCEERSVQETLLPYGVDVVALDQPGIINQLASFFTDRHIRLVELTTSSYTAINTGASMFSLRMSISVPSSTHLATLRDEFTEFCDSLNLDAVLEPIKG